METIKSFGGIQWAIVIIVVVSTIVMGVEAKDVALAGVSGLVGVLVGEANGS